MCIPLRILQEVEIWNRSHRTPPSRSARSRAALSPTSLLLHLSNSTGVVDNYEEIYCPAHWKQPDTYARFSDTVEESGASAIIDGFSYSMDNEWLDRNNEEARGEGTRAQGTLATSGTTTQCQGERQGTGLCSACYYLGRFVMGIFENVTHDKTRSFIPYVFCCPLHVNFDDRSPVNRA